MGYGLDNCFHLCCPINKKEYENENENKNENADNILFG
jgi:hypothetical protein